MNDKLSHLKTCVVCKTGGILSSIVTVEVQSGDNAIDSEWHIIISYTTGREYRHE